MKIRVKVQTQGDPKLGYAMSGLMVDHNKVIYTGPFFNGLVKTGERWPVVRNRLLFKGLIVTEQMEDEVPA